MSAEEQRVSQQEVAERLQITVDQLRSYLNTAGIDLVDQPDRELTQAEVDQLQAEVSKE